jgi:hypothetical protein
MCRGAAPFQRGISDAVLDTIRTLYFTDLQEAARLQKNMMQLVDNEGRVHILTVAGTTTIGRSRTNRVR